MFVVLFDMYNKASYIKPNKKTVIYEMLIRLLLTYDPSMPVIYNILTILQIMVKIALPYFI